MIVIQFLKHSRPYNAGEIAGFEDDLAQRYIDQGIAEVFKPKTMESPEVKRAAKKPAKKTAAKKTAKKSPKKK